MKTIEIFGEDRYPKHTKMREGCRGILIRDEKILLSYEKNEDQYLIPGGGIEPGESLADCCIRELREETGVIVNPQTHYLTLEEYYHEYYFKSHYFICDYLADGEQKLTEGEAERGLEPVWVEFDKALSIFGSYEKYKEINKMRYGAYYREYLALSEYTKTVTD
jgi:8-oxo-dGTP pyrophosphatase MutT (NUDIX family)